MDRLAQREILNLLRRVLCRSTYGRLLPKGRKNPLGIEVLDDFLSGFYVLFRSSLWYVCHLLPFNGMPRYTILLTFEQSPQKIFRRR